MIRTPAHKQTDPAKAPGQIRTLGDYILTVVAEEGKPIRPKKLSFEQWWALNRTAENCYYGLSAAQCRNIWSQAQENV